MKKNIHIYLLLRSFLINIANERELLCNSGDVQTDFAWIALLQKPSLRVHNRLLLFDIELHNRKRLGQTSKCRGIAARKTLSCDVHMNGRCVQFCSAVAFGHGDIEPEPQADDGRITWTDEKVKKLCKLTQCLKIGLAVKL